MFHRICFALILLLVTTSQSFAVTPEEVKSVLTTRFRITKPAFLGGFNEIGSVLSPCREGLRANRPSKAFEPNLVRSSQLLAAGGGELPLGGVHDGALKPGERLYLYGIRTGENYVQLDLYTVATYVVPGSGMRGPSPLQASVRFLYEGGLEGVTKNQLLKEIGEWLIIEGESRPAEVESRPAAVESQPYSEPRPADNPSNTIRLGQTREEVTSILGPPDKQVLLGAKILYVYRNLKVVFVGGKVADAY